MKNFFTSIKDAFFSTLSFVLRTSLYLVGVALALCVLIVLGFIGLDLFLDIAHTTLTELNRH